MSLLCLKNHHFSVFVLTGWISPTQTCPDTNIPVAHQVLQESWCTWHTQSCFQWLRSDKLERGMCWSFSLFYMKTWIFHAFLLILTCTLALTWVFGQPETTFTDLHLLLLFASLPGSNFDFLLAWGNWSQGKEQKPALPMWWWAQKEGGCYLAWK